MIDDEKEIGASRGSSNAFWSRVRNSVQVDGVKWLVWGSDRFLGTSGHFMASNGASNALVNNVRLSNSVSPDLVITGS